MLGFEVTYNDDSIQSSGVDWNSCVVQDYGVGKCESEDTHVRQFSSCSPSQTVVWSSNPPTYLWYLRYHCSNVQSSNIGGSAFIPLKIYLKIFSYKENLKLHIVVPGNWNSQLYVYALQRHNLNNKIPLLKKFCNI